MAQAASTATPQNPINNAVSLVSEILVPGGSHLVKGDIVGGIVHAAAGVVATAIWGLPGRVVVKASSYSKATTGKRLYEHVLGALQKDEPAPAPTS